MDNSQLDYTVPKPELERSEQFIQPWQVSNQFIVTWINETSYWSLFLATSIHNKHITSDNSESRDR